MSDDKYDFDPPCKSWVCPGLWFMHMWSPSDRPNWDICATVGLTEQEMLLPKPELDLLLATYKAEAVRQIEECRKKGPPQCLRSTN